VESATFLGQSMGGTIALKLAHQYPELVNGLVLLASPPKDPTDQLPTGMLGKYMWKTLITVNKHNRLLVRLLYRLLLYRFMNGFSLPLREIIRHLGFNPLLARTEDIEEYIEKLLAVNANLFFDLAADLVSFDITRLDPPISCRALVICGAQDRVIPLATHRWLAKNLLASELEIVKHGSHCPHFDDPGLVNKLIARFLKTLTL